MHRLIKSFKYSVEGLISCYKYEPAFRLECLTLLAAIPLSFLISESYMDTILLIGSILIIMIAELLNSAIENVNDRIGKEYHELCKLAKDQSSAAVFVAILLALIIWITITMKYFLD